MTNRDNDMLHLEPVDADVDLIARFLTGSMTEAEEAAVEERMAGDAAFYDKVAPLIKVWMMPVRFGTLMERSAAAREVVAAVGHEPSLELAPAKSTGAVIEEEWFGRAMPTGPGTFGKRLKYAAWVIWGYLLGVDRREGMPERLIDRHPAWNRAFQWALRFNFAVLIALTFLIVPISYYGSPESFLLRRTVRSMIAAPSYGRTPTVQLGGGGVFEVPLGVPGVRVVAGASEVRLAPGRYAIGGNAAGDLIMVTVAAGLATMRADTTQSDSVRVATGEFGRVINGIAEKVGAASAAGFPMVPVPAAGVRR